MSDKQRGPQMSPWTTLPLVERLRLLAKWEWVVSRITIEERKIIDDGAEEILRLRKAIEEFLQEYAECDDSYQRTQVLNQLRNALEGKE